MSTSKSAMVKTKKTVFSDRGQWNQRPPTMPRSW
jgi:hypothetical protein